MFKNKNIWKDLRCNVFNLAYGRLEPIYRRESRDIWREWVPVEYSSGEERIFVIVRMCVYQSKCKWVGMSGLSVCDKCAVYRKVAIGPFSHLFSHICKLNLAIIYPQPVNFAPTVHSFNCTVRTSPSSCTVTFIYFIFLYCQTPSGDFGRFPG